MLSSIPLENDRALAVALRRPGHRESTRAKHFQRRDTVVEHQRPQPDPGAELTTNQRGNFRQHPATVAATATVRGHHDRNLRDTRLDVSAHLADRFAVITEDPDRRP